jgi:hypothetical protein
LHFFPSLPSSFSSFLLLSWYWRMT